MLAMKGKAEPAALLKGGLSPEVFFQVEVALHSAAGLRPDPIPAPMKTCPRYAPASASALRAVRTSCSRRPRSARASLHGGDPFPSRGEGIFRQKPSFPGRASVCRVLGRSKIALPRAFAAPFAPLTGKSSSLSAAVAPVPAEPLLPCSAESQVSRIAFWAIRSGKGGRRFPRPSLPHPTLSLGSVHMEKLYLPTNHCVEMQTLDAIRRRHPVLTSARPYAPGRYEIGFGNRSSIGPDMAISPCQAEDLLRNDIMYVEANIRLRVARRISDACYQALVSYLYDVGPKAEEANRRLSALHAGGLEAFAKNLNGAAGESRYGVSVGASARFWECRRIASDL